MIIKILGSGCTNCTKLEENARIAASELGLDAKIEKVKDMKEILSFGVMRTPALVVDGKVRLMGRVASVDEIKNLLK